MTDRVCYNCGHFHDVTGFTMKNCGSCWQHNSIVLETDYCDAFISKCPVRAGPESDILQWKKYANSTD